MSDMDILREMIRESAQERLQYENDKPFVILRETDGKPYTVTIRELPSDALIIKIDDSFKQPDTVFNGAKGECSRADYAIISAEQKRIIYIEMKSGQEKEPGKVTKQLKGAHCFIEYCMAVGRLFWKKTDFLEDCKCRFFSIKNIKLSKESSVSNRRQNQYDVPNTPNEYHKMSNSKNFKFKDFAWFGVDK